MHRREVVDGHRLAAGAVARERRHDAGHGLRAVASDDRLQFAEVEVALPGAGDRGVDGKQAAPAPAGVQHAHAGARLPVCSAGCRRGES
jgi:hypothetical protein